MLPFINALRAAFAAACTAVALMSSSALAHGGLSMDEDYCKLRVGQYVMHFVGYQPDSVSGPKEFCEDIPQTGRTIVVLDYVDDALRDLPTEVRIIRDTGSVDKIEDLTLLHLPPKIYPTGSINFELNFPAAGKFVGLVTVAGSDQFVSRFPFSVGRHKSWLHIVVPVLLLAGGAVLLYRFAVRRRSKAGVRVA
jgi:hypothetical protein